jgi:hypothetical protein|tara:strand:+ start:1229 stop:2077 length:849 start_codon:yes stop_codon:yes gene_type:complete
MAHNFKVAVCWSGQMRTHNEKLIIYDDVINGRVVKTNAIYNPDSPTDGFAINNSTEKTNIFKVIDDLMLYDFEVDHYGHTWTDCELPVNKDKFKSFIQEDQIVIDEWVDEDAESRQPNVPEFTSKGSYGQTWSGFRAYELVEGNYNAVIRIRWDVLCYSTKELANWIRHLIYDQGESWRDRTLNEKLSVPTEYYRTPVTWVTGDNLATINPGTINDIFWISNTHAFELWKEIDFKKKLHHVLATNHGRTPQSHKLWNLMQPPGINCIGYLPENFCEIKREYF